MKQNHRIENIAQHIQEVLKPIVYADIFDYPLLFDEVYTFLECQASPVQVENWLAQAVFAGQVVQIDKFYCLTNRTELVAKRLARQKIAGQLWPQARYYGHWIASLPFVTMVAVTGSLAVNNPREDFEDVDYLVVTRPGRLWLCRAMIIMMVRFGHRRGIQLCPNYLITENALAFEADFFAAREIIQMVPLYGQKIYGQIRQENDWLTQYFPQGSASTKNIDEHLPFLRRVIKKTGERMLAGFVGNWLEFWLQRYQLNKHTRQAKTHQTGDSMLFTADVCKGHYDGHRRKTMQTYQQRIDNQSLNGAGNSSAGSNRTTPNERSLYG